jgi:hypothetical protein
MQFSLNTSAHCFKGLYAVLFSVIVKKQSVFE